VWNKNHAREEEIYLAVEVDKMKRNKISGDVKTPNDIKLLLVEMSKLPIKNLVKMSKLLMK
jgi:hypothetical protein